MGYLSKPPINSTGFCGNGGGVGPFSASDFWLNIWWEMGETISFLAGKIQADSKFGILGIVFFATVALDYT